jgi:hypothetical protein
MNLTLILSKIGLSQKLSQDIMLVLFIALVSFVYGMLIGRYRLMTVLINIYVSFAVISVVPASLLADYSSKIIAFFAVIVGLTVLNKRFFEIVLSSTGAGFLFRVFSMSFLQMTLMLSIILSYLPQKVALEYVSKTAYSYLVVDWAMLFWMVAPLAYMFFIYKRISR